MGKWRPRSSRQGARGMDNLGRDMERMMWKMLIGGFLFGVGAVLIVSGASGGIIWMVQGFSR